MRYLTVAEIVYVHEAVIAASGGSSGILRPDGLDSAAAQPRMTFGVVDLYPTLAEKAAALGFSLIQNHSFVDGNKRIAHAAIEVFLLLNGSELKADVDDSEQMILAIASGCTERTAFATWLADHIVPSREGNSI